MQQNGIHRSQMTSPTLGGPKQLIKSKGPYFINTQTPKTNFISPKPSKQQPNSKDQTSDYEPIQQQFEIIYQQQSCEHLREETRKNQQRQSQSSASVRNPKELDSLRKQLQELLTEKQSLKSYICLLENANQEKQRLIDQLRQKYEKVHKDDLQKSCGDFHQALHQNPSTNKFHTAHLSRAINALTSPKNIVGKKDDINSKQNDEFIQRYQALLGKLSKKVDSSHTTSRNLSPSRNDLNPIIQDRETERALQDLLGGQTERFLNEIKNLKESLAQRDIQLMLAEKNACVKIQELLAQINELRVELAKKDSDSNGSQERIETQGILQQKNELIDTLISKLKTRETQLSELITQVQNFEQKAQQQKEEMTQINDQRNQLQIKYNQLVYEIEEFITQMIENFNCDINDIEHPLSSISQFLRRVKFSTSTQTDQEFFQFQFRFASDLEVYDASKKSSFTECEGVTKKIEDLMNRVSPITPVTGLEDEQKKSLISHRSEMSFQEDLQQKVLGILELETQLKNLKSEYHEKYECLLSENEAYKNYLAFLNLKLQGQELLSRLGIVYPLQIPEVFKESPRFILASNFHSSNQSNENSQFTTPIQTPHLIDGPGETVINEESENNQINFHRIEEDVQEYQSDQSVHKVITRENHQQSMDASVQQDSENMIIHELTEQLQKVQAEKDKLEQVLREVEFKVRDFEQNEAQQLLILRESLQKQHELIDEYKIQFAQQQEENQKLSQKVDQSQQVYDEKQKEKENELENKIVELQTQIDEIKIQNESLNEKVKQSNNKLRITNNAKSKIEQEVICLKSIQQEYKDEMTQQYKEIAELQEEINKYKSSERKSFDEENYPQSIENLNKIQDLQDENQKIKHQLEEQKNKSLSLSSELLELNIKITELQEQCNGNTNTKQMLEVESQTESTEELEIFGMFGQIQSQLQDLHQVINRQTVEIRELGNKSKN